VGFEEDGEGLLHQQNNSCRSFSESARKQECLTVAIWIGHILTHKSLLHNGKLLIKTTTRRK